MKRSALVAAGILALIGSLGLPDAQAQEAAKVARIGWLSPSLGTNLQFPEAFRRGMSELGYVEGRHFVIEYRSANGEAERYSAAATELVALKVDVIVAGGTLATKAAMQATKSIPIVFPIASEPVADGLVASLVRQTGYPDRELLKEFDIAARTLGLQIQLIEVGRPEDIDKAFSDIRRWHANAVTVSAGAIFLEQRKRLADLATENRLPAVYWAKDFVEAGGLMSYGADWSDLYRRAAIHVDKILKGAKPGDLPVERPTKFEMIINLKAARTLGLTLPPAVVARADEVVDR